MPVEIVMPKLGLTMKEGQITEWKFAEGDTVEKGKVLFILETEKVTYDVESPESGVLAKILFRENETVPVGTVVGLIAKPGEDLSGVLAVGSPPSAGPPKAPTPEGFSPVATEKTAEVARKRVSPLAMKISRAHGVDLDAIAGSGPGGRILRADVEAAMKHEGEASAPAAISAAVGVGAAAEEILVPFTGMRRAIARKMLASKVETAQTYMSVTVDASKIVEYRQTLLPLIIETHDVRVTVTDLMMKITAAAIVAHPVINTQWTPEGIRYLRSVHMGMAMALENGLIVPVIRNITKKTFAEIAKDRTELIRKGKANQFLPDDISGSTFTLSAMGMFGIEQFTSNINLPESAILAVGAIIDKPVAIDGAVVIRPMMTVTLSYDHRVIDGAEAGKFMRTLKSYIENPIRMFA